MKCVECGKKISKDSVFCEYCGTKVEKQPQPTKESKKGKLGVIIISLLLVISISLNVILALCIKADETTSSEIISELNNKINELEKHTYPSTTIDGTEISVNDENNINNLKSIGSFSSIKELKKAIQRNVDNPQYMKVQITGYIIRTDKALYICTIEDSDYETYLNMKKHLKEGDSASALYCINSNNDYKISIYMLDDTKDRVLTGDKVKITGVLNTKAMYVYKCTYEFIK